MYKRQGYLVTATERGNNRAGESLVEFALKNNDAEMCIRDRANMVLPLEDHVVWVRLMPLQAAMV